MATDQYQTQLDEYYRLNLRHLRWSFWSSLVALTAGLVVLLAGIYLMLTGNLSLVSQLSTVAGVLTQFIAAGFFFLYSKNLKQLNVFYEKLIKHQDTMYAISLANQLPAQEKSNAYLALIGALLSRGEAPTSPELLKAIVQSKNPTKDA